MIARATTTPWSSDHDRFRAEPLLQARRHHRGSLLESIRPAVEALLHRRCPLSTPNGSEATEDTWVSATREFSLLAARNPVARQRIWAESGVDLTSTEVGECTERPNSKPREETSEVGAFEDGDVEWSEEGLELTLAHDGASVGRHGGGEESRGDAEAHRESRPLEVHTHRSEDGVIPSEQSTRPSHGKRAEPQSNWGHPRTDRLDDSEELDELTNLLTAFTLAAELGGEYRNQTFHSCAFHERDLAFGGRQPERVSARRSPHPAATDEDGCSATGEAAVAIFGSDPRRFAHPQFNVTTDRPVSFRRRHHHQGCSTITDSSEELSSSRVGCGGTEGEEDEVDPVGQLSGYLDGSPTFCSDEDHSAEIHAEVGHGHHARIVQTHHAAPVTSR